MMGLVMAGGRSSRMGRGEKLTAGWPTPMVWRALEALERCPQITGVAAAVSGGAPRTRSMLERMGVRTIQTAGGGYSADLPFALNGMGGPTIILPGDLPLIDADAISRIIEWYEERFWVTVLLEERYAAMLRLSPGATTVHEGTLCRYAGISMVEPARMHEAATKCVIMNDFRIAANMNAPQDWEVLESSGAAAL